MIYTSHYFRNLKKIVFWGGSLHMKDFKTPSPILHTFSAYLASTTQCKNYIGWAYPYIQGRQYVQITGIESDEVLPLTIIIGHKL